MTYEQQQLIVGFVAILIGAICGGSFGLPSKFVKKDTPWEVLWGPFFFFVTILIPAIVTPLVVDDVHKIYGTLEFAGDDIFILSVHFSIILVLAFGFLWGTGSMTLGMSFSFIGLSLAYALNYGAQIACGFTLPMLLFDAKEFLTLHGGVILAGVVVCLLGVVVSGWAGILKERSQKSDDKSAEPDEAANSTKKPKILIGLLLAFVSGILCACYAVAYSCGEQHIGVVAGAKDGANNPAWAVAWAITAMILWGGAVSSCVYCAIQLTRNRTWGHLVKPGILLVLALAAAMAVLHNAAIFCFGLGASKLGDLGVPAGYPVFMSLAIIVGNVHGFRTGEWKGASRQSIIWIIVGIAILIVGVCIIAQGKAMMGT